MHRWRVDIKGLKSQLGMQTQVTTCNNTAVKGNNLKSKLNNHDGEFRKILKALFTLVFVGSPSLVFSKY